MNEANNGCGFRQPRVTREIGQFTSSISALERSLAISFRSCGDFCISCSDVPESENTSGCTTLSPLRYVARSRWVHLSQCVNSVGLVSKKLGLDSPLLVFGFLVGGRSTDGPPKSSIKLGVGVYTKDPDCYESQAEYTRVKSNSMSLLLQPALPCFPT